MRKPIQERSLPAVLWLTLALAPIPGLAQAPIVETESSDDPDFRDAPRLTNIGFGGHTLFANPRYMDSEVNGGFRAYDRLDVGGFFGVVPTTFGHGGTHYGELKTTIRLIGRGDLLIGPSVERVTASNTPDFTKYGVTAKAKVGGVSLDLELFPYATRGAGGGGAWFLLPLPGPWKIDGFWNYLRGGVGVGKLNLKYAVNSRVEVLVEYFHNGFNSGGEQDRISAGIGYKLR